MALLKEIKYYLVCLFLGAAAGYFLRGKYMATRETVKYIQGEPVEKLIPVPEPYYVSTPVKPLFFFRTITRKDTIIQEVDTARIINDWVMERQYKETLFDDQNGKMDVELSLQYNKLQSLRYSYLPVQKVVTSYREKVFKPYVGVSYYSNGYGSVSGGVFYKDIGIEFGYLTDFVNNSLGIGLRYGF